MTRTGYAVNIEVYGRGCKEAMSPGLITKIIMDRIVEELKKLPSNDWCYVIVDSVPQ